MDGATIIIIEIARPCRLLFQLYEIRNIADGSDASTTPQVLENHIIVYISILLLLQVKRFGEELDGCIVRRRMVSCYLNNLKPRYRIWSNFVQLILIKLLFVVFLYDQNSPRHTCMKNQRLCQLFPELLEKIRSQVHLLLLCIINSKMCRNEMCPADLTERVDKKELLLVVTH